MNQHNKNIDHDLQLLTSLRNIFFRRLLRYRYRDSIIRVRIEEIRCTDLPFTRHLGFGGKPINYFPPHTFFQLYLQDPVAALNEYCLWMERCFVEEGSWKIPGNEGGWQSGGLVRTLEQLHRGKGIFLNGYLDKADPVLLKEVIQIRAKKYLNLFQSIRNKGFLYGKGHPLRGIFKNDICYLEGGHHRVSALSVLGYQEIEILKVEKE